MPTRPVNSLPPATNPPHPPHRCSYPASTPANQWGSLTASRTTGPNAKLRLSLLPQPSPSTAARPAPCLRYVPSDPQPRGDTRAHLHTHSRHASIPTPPPQSGPTFAPTDLGLSTDANDRDRSLSASLATSSRGATPVRRVRFELSAGSGSDDDDDDDDDDDSSAPKGLPLATAVLSGQTDALSPVEPPRKIGGGLLPAKESPKSAEQTLRCV
jgi:hypothetical protein